MTETTGNTLSVEVSEQMMGDVTKLGKATGRDTYDIVTSALRTYLADEERRRTVIAHLGTLPEGYPSAYFVTCHVGRQGDAVFDHEARARAELTFSQINRFRPSVLDWGGDGASLTVSIGVSGQTPQQASATAVKMIRNRIVDELGLASSDSLAIEVSETRDVLDD